jgi:hypothetical protein
MQLHRMFPYFREFMAVTGDKRGKVIPELYQTYRDS